jgi:Flp pilus assembly protein TadD
MSEEKALEKLEPFRADLSLLLEAGFVAAKQMDEVGATRIFCAAQVLDRMNTSPQVGLGYIALNKLQIKQALAIFQRVLETEPTNMIAQAFMGICYLLSKNKRKKGEKIIKDTLAGTKDETIINLCHVAMKWADKDLSNPTMATKLVELPENA